jgi:hypothetical protein
MRRLALLVAVLLAGAAAADDSKKSTGQETKEAGQAAAGDTKQGAQNATDWSKQQGDKAATSAQEAGRDAQAQTNQAQGSAQQATNEAHDRMKKDSFDIDGKISRASASQLTIQRDNAPAATLHVDKATKIEVDGQHASAKELKPGQDVKASFNLKGDKPTAVDIKAEKQK